MATVSQLFTVTRNESRDGVFAGDGMRKVRIEVAPRNGSDPASDKGLDAPGRELLGGFTLAVDQDLADALFPIGSVTRLTFTTSVR